MPKSTSRRAALVFAAGAAPAAVAVALPSPAIAMDNRQSATLARFEQLLNVLHTRHIADGFTVDETAADQALGFFKRRANGDRTDDVAGEQSAIDFIRSHGGSLDWVFDGDLEGLLAYRASHSTRAASIAFEADPLIAAIEAHDAAAIAFDNVLDAKNELEETLLSQEGNISCCDDPRWIEAEEGEINASELMDRRATEILDMEPKSVAAAAAVLRHMVNHYRRFNGSSWPDSLIDEDAENSKSKERPFECFLMETLAKGLERISKRSAFA